MHRSSLAALLLAAAALGGCATTGGTGGGSSTSKFTGDQKLVANTIEDLETDSRPGQSDTGKICRDLVTADLQKQLASHGKSCEDAVGDALRNADAYQLTVQTVKITGTRAVATVKVETGDKDQIQSVGLEKVGGGWRIYRFP